MFKIFVSRALESSDHTLICSILFLPTLQRVVQGLLCKHVGKKLTFVMLIITNPNDFVLPALFIVVSNIVVKHYSGVTMLNNIVDNYKHNASKTSILSGQQCWTMLAIKTFKQNQI